MQRRRAEEPLPSADRWLLSWSDFVTLLLALFAAMYAGASVDLAKARLVAQSVGSALRSSGQVKGEPQVVTRASSAGTVATTVADAPGGAAATHPPTSPQPSKAEAEGGQAAEMVAALRAAMNDVAGGDRVRIVHEAAGVGIDIDATLLFATADARLAPQAEAALSALSGVLSRWTCNITVEGHTDRLPIHTLQFGSNWELSAMRAAMVARRLSEQGIANERLTAVGRSDTRPQAANDTAAGRASNRRVHLIVTLAANATRAEH
ncbi:MAG: hypothetical protein RL404_2274 [Pseudomonadota bacterium]